MIVIGNLAHLMVEDPLGKLASEFLLSHQVESLFHVGDLFHRHLDSMFAQHYDRYIARVAVENREGERVMELGVPLGIASELAQITRTVGHSASSFIPDCARLASAA